MTDAGSVRWSLIVPSYNGEDTLPDCLASLAEIVRTAEAVEAIVIDNASTDGTARLLQDFAARSGALFLSEPRSGKSNALNTAIEHARGEMLLFLDDDVIADPRLVDAYAAAERSFPDAAVFAGQVRPGWRAPAPGWLQALTDEGRSCGCTPLALQAGRLDARHVKGANMAIRRSALGAARFSTGSVNFGATAQAIGGEDSELVRRLGSEGGIRYVQEATVRHLVSADEMRWKAVFARYVRIGRGNAAQSLSGRSIVPVAARAAARAALAALAFALGRKTVAARHGVQLAMRIGALDYLTRKRT